MSSTSDAAEAIVAGAGVLAGLGAAIKWLLGYATRRVDRREHDLDTREADLDRKVDNRLAALEADMKRMRDELENHRIALHVLVAKVARDDPHAPELKQVADLLGQAYPLHLSIPKDMSDQLDRIP